MDDITIPEEAWKATGLPKGIAVRAIAAALAAWPGAFEFPVGDAEQKNIGGYFILPLTQEPQITPSCGCVFCDIGAPHPDGIACTKKEPTND